MQFEPALQQGILVKRYKRFLADIKLTDGSEMTIHCPNTGSMRNCLFPEKPCGFQPLLTLNVNMHTRGS
ncbi:XRE family transcriptional regulator [Shewanella putrefaciens]|nr:XRE family transcriptional regulator [Shewanella putrefaciens]